VVTRGSGFAGTILPLESVIGAVTLHREANAFNDYRLKSR
jgi:hypothetical protein